ncbi:M23 family metallopeptidase [Bordetella genomosp. 4]|uniref:M23 family metallopeptidase n=1 Tax=Bordetella genomosp. 4 TaxID=463044 RepID=UPI0015951238|nr:M23 family metallopeptidase [Bordetella genomosp. 4]
MHKPVTSFLGTLQGEDFFQATYSDTLSVFAISTPSVSYTVSSRDWATPAWHRICLVLCLCLAIVLAGCSSTGSGKVEPGYYRVQAGDTLNKIARQHNTSVSALMRLNNLSNPDRITKGQLLRVDGASGTAPTESANETTGSRTSGTRVPAASSSSSAAVVRGLKLVWPAEGTLTQRYNGSSSKGLTIVNKAGTPVKAAAAGSVVYAGNRLRGYGNLVIVQHSGDFLSIYAHNSKLLVKEGQKVSQGQQIADMGNTDRKGPGLYFELRHRGQPVDPSAALPQR